MPMHLHISCMECFKELGRPDLRTVQLTVRDDGYYETVCARGHRSVTLLQAELYETLFELGVNAILDGYYREAVSSFSASLERFYEFALRVLLHGNSVPTAATTAAWKAVTSQSERQLGAFVFLWLHKFHEAPSLLPTTVVQRRNDVIHKGKIPSKEDALTFGEAVFSSIAPKLGRLRAELGEDVEAVTFATVKSGHIAAKERALPTSTMAIATIFQRESFAAPADTVEAYLEHARKRRAVMQGVGL